MSAASARAGAVRHSLSELAEFMPERALVHLELVFFGFLAELQETQDRLEATEEQLARLEVLAELSPDTHPGEVLLANHPELGKKV